MADEAQWRLSRAHAAVATDRAHATAANAAAAAATERQAAHEARQSDACARDRVRNQQTAIMAAEAERSRRIYVADGRVGAAKPHGALEEAALDMERRTHRRLNAQASEQERADRLADNARQDADSAAERCANQEKALRMMDEAREAHVRRDALADAADIEARETAQWRVKRATEAERRERIWAGGGERRPSIVFAGGLGGALESAARIHSVRTQAEAERASRLRDEADRLAAGESERRSNQRAAMIAMDDERQHRQSAATLKQAHLELERRFNAALADAAAERERQRRVAEDGHGSGYRARRVSLVSRTVEADELTQMALDMERKTNQRLALRAHEVARAERVAADAALASAEAAERAANARLADAAAEEGLRERLAADRDLRICGARERKMNASRAKRLTEAERAERVAAAGTHARPSSLAGVLPEFAAELKPPAKAVWVRQLADAERADRLHEARRREAEDEAERELNGYRADAAADEERLERIIGNARIAAAAERERRSNQRRADAAQDAERALRLLDPRVYNEEPQPPINAAELDSAAKAMGVKVGRRMAFQQHDALCAERRALDAALDAAAAAERRENQKAALRMMDAALLEKTGFLAISKRDADRDRATGRLRARRASATGLKERLADFSAHGCRPAPAAQFHDEMEKAANRILVKNLADEEQRLRMRDAVDREAANDAERAANRRGAVDAMEKERAYRMQQDQKQVRPR
ncbi:hypothetical protein M885DRAFT_535417 [Pelagophyceae sp. CCMP2097]|nr:hypothetical protein M885DRAFT_535417 [Pelagophyceae sp. CCMP2097]